MKRARAVASAGAVAAVVLALVGCSNDNPTLSPGAVAPDGGIGNRGVQLVPDSAAPEAKVAFRDAADVAMDKPASEVLVDGAQAGIDAALPPKLTVTILSPSPAGVDGGTAAGEASDGGTGDGGAPPIVISAASRLAPKVSIEVQSRGGDPTAEVLASVKASLVTVSSPPVTQVSIALNQTQFMVLPESDSKIYIFSDTPLDLSNVPSGFYNVQVDATTAGGTTASASVSVYIDGGPSITFLQPAEGAYVKGSVIVTAIVSDDRAGVSSVAFSIGQTALPSSAITHSGVQYTATIDFGSFDPPLDGAQIVTVTAVNGNAIPSLATRKFTVDNTGPLIANTRPAAGALIGKILTIEAQVTDPAGVMADSVIAVVAHGDVHFEVELPLASDGLYRNLFDTTQLPTYAIYPSISFRAQDVLGNQSSVGYLVSLDNTPPILDLDPGMVRLLRDSDGACSWPFDPVGPDSVDDGSIVNQMFDVRARVEDRGNLPLTGTLDFDTIATVDPAAVKVLILDDTSLPLVVDTSDPPDGLCDDVNPELTPSVSPQSSKDAQLLDMTSLPPDQGAADFTLEPGSPCSGHDSSPPAWDTFCGTTYNAAKKAYMTYSMGYGPGPQPSIWTLGPVVSDRLQCAGRQFDASNNLKDGWACLAVEAADKLGNKQVSRPIRICVAAKDDTACTVAKLGAPTVASVTIPSSATAKIAFTTSSPLLGTTGAALVAGDSVAFLVDDDASPVAALKGLHTVAPADTSGKSFTLTDLLPTPTQLVVDDGSGAVAQGEVGLTLSEGGLLHVSTPAGSSTVLAASFQGLVALVGNGFSASTTYSVSNIQASGFDLAGSTMKLTSGAMAVPNCTGTVVKQAAGLPSKVDGSKPCKPWATF